MQNSIVNIVVFSLIIMLAHFLVGLTVSMVIGAAMGIFMADLLQAISNDKE